MAYFSRRLISVWVVSVRSKSLVKEVELQYYYSCVSVKGIWPPTSPFICFSFLMVLCDHFLYTDLYLLICVITTQLMAKYIFPNFLRWGRGTQSMPVCWQPLFTSSSHWAGQGHFPSSPVQDQGRVRTYHYWEAIWPSWLLLISWLEAYSLSTSGIHVIKTVHTSIFQKLNLNYDEMLQQHDTLSNSFSSSPLLCRHLQETDDSHLPTAFPYSWIPPIVIPNVGLL